jgi:hypothetical protein
VPGRDPSASTTEQDGRPGPTVSQGRRRNRRLISGITLWSLVGGLITLGPALRRGAVLNLDLILVPKLDLPSGIWGLGPELPRRLPLWDVPSAISRVISAELTGKALMVAIFVIAATGMARLMRMHGPFVANLAGLLYAFNPFVLTRTAVGHFNVTVPLAILPWVVPYLLHPTRRLTTTYVCALALGFGGHFGGSMAFAVVAVGVVVNGWHRWWAAAAVTIAAQAPWLIPGLIVAHSTGLAISDSSVFATKINDVGDLARVSAGGGFWNSYFQAGGAGIPEAIVGVSLLVLAIIGSRRLDPTLRRGLVVLGVAGWLITVGSGIAPFDRLFEAATGNLVGGVWRESQRALTLHLVWLMPSAVLGARQVASRLERSARGAWAARPVALAPIAALAVLAVPSIWGIGGQLEATPIPQDWQHIRQAIKEDPGPAVALPWYQYFNLRVGDGAVHRVLNPLPLYLGGDVISSSSNGLGRNVREQADTREATVGEIVHGIQDGTPGGVALAEQGVRWVVLLKTVGFEAFAEMDSDPRLERVIDGGDIVAYRVLDPAPVNAPRRWRLGAVVPLLSQTIPFAIGAWLLVLRRRNRRHLVEPVV